MAEIYLTKTLFKCLSRHLGKEALAGDKMSWTLDLMARAVSLITNRYKMLSTIIRNLIRFKAFIDSLELDQVDGALEPEGAPEPKIDQTPLLNALAKCRQAIDDKKLATKNN